MAGIRSLRRVWGSLLEALGFEAVGAGGLDHVARLAAVARDAAGHAQLFERHPAAIVGEDDGERRGAALDRFHLEDGGRAHPGGRHLQSPSFSRRVGMTSAMGRSSLTTTPPEARVPLLIFKLGPREEDQR